MNKQARHYMHLMNDYKHFGIVLLALGSFLYLGSILPSSSNTIKDIYIMIVPSCVLLLSSIFFFIRSKHYRSLLIEMDEGNDI